MAKKKIVPRRVKKRVADMTPEEYEANKLYRKLEARRYHARLSPERKKELSIRAVEYEKRKRLERTPEEQEAYSKARWKQVKKRIAKKSEEEQEQWRQQRREINKRWHRKNYEQYRHERRRQLENLPEKEKLRRQEQNRRRTAYHRNNRTAAEKKQTIEYQKRWMQRRRAEDLQFRILSNIRVRLGNAVRRRKSEKANKKTRDLFGCEWETFVSHIEQQFTKKMNWENWGRNGWHIDHIVPLSAFDLAKVKELEVASYYLNHRPIWGNENMKKAARMPAKKDVPLKLRKMLYELDKDFFSRKTYVRKG